jgi:hypothetical protein
MPGQIKIDDGAGNYTVLTNGGSLGSDKTITIPNTTGTMALTSDISSGLAGAQKYKLTADISTTGTVDITSNLALSPSTLESNYGSLISESSGIFSFSETGYYLILTNASSTNNTDNSYAQIYMYTSNDNFSTSSSIGRITNRMKASGHSTGSMAHIINITDTTNDKVKFATDITSGGVIEGSTVVGFTTFTFLKLKD